MAEINSEVTLYDMNKSFLQEATPLSASKVREGIDKLALYFINGRDAGHRYFMLLNKERSDYTLFNLKENWNIDNGKLMLKNCLINRGDIMSINKTEDNYAYEIWMRIEEEIFVYYLFPYDEGVVEL